MMRVAFAAALLLLGGCSAHEGSSFHERLYEFAHAGMTRIGDTEAAGLQPSRVHSPRECAVLLRPDARVALSSYETLRDLCVKPSFGPRGIEVAAFH